MITKNDSTRQCPPMTTSHIDELLHAIALAMARRQMQLAWPRAA